eukprot:3135201-Amphidinium_carterae.1
MLRPCKLPKLVSRGVGQQHRTIKHGDEELPLIGLDFGFLNGSGDADRPVTFLAAADSDTKSVFAMPLTRKGATDFAAAKFVEWLRSLGHRSMLLQSDGEPAMTARSQAIGVENHLGARVPHGHALMLFALTHAAKCISCYRLGAEGKTPEELRTGRAWRKTMATFGERLLGFPLKEDSRKRDVEPKSVPGLFLGHAPRTATTLILTPGGRRRRSRRRRRPEE